MVNLMNNLWNYWGTSPPIAAQHRLELCHRGCRYKTKNEAQAPENEQKDYGTSIDVSPAKESYFPRREAHAKASSIEHSAASTWFDPQPWPERPDTFQSSLRYRSFVGVAKGQCSQIRTKKKGHAVITSIQRSRAHQKIAAELPRIQ
jgi:hypothetical protein